MLDTSNKFAVGCAAGGVVIFAPPRFALPKADALMLAAWIVCLSGGTVEEFRESLEAVENT